MITRTQFIKNYKAAEQRAQPCAQGLAFTIEDRISLHAQRRQLNLTSSQAAWAVAANGQDASKAVSRFNLWEDQIVRGEIRMAPLPTGEHVGKETVTCVPFDGRIKTKADIQPAFNKAAVQLVRLGITNTREAEAYLANGFQHALTEQKIDIKAERLLTELRMGDMTKPQILATLERVKASL